MGIAREILKDLVEELRTLTKTETIVGTPFTVGEFTLVPISRVMLGVGAGSGACGTEKKGASGEGGGGGGGIRVWPVALVAVRDGELSVHMLGRGATLAHSFEKMPDLVEKSLEKLLDSWKVRKAKEGKED